MQLISYLDSLRPAREAGQGRRPGGHRLHQGRPLRGAIHDPEAFARANAPGLWRLCESRLKHFRFYCSGVAGSTGKLVDRDGGETLVPLRIEPRGIVEPFAWLIAQVQLTTRGGQPGSTRARRVAEQAIFTSLPRRGKAGYHLVARSPGVSDSEATTLATWSPSHGALIVDAPNRTSVNFLPLPGGRFALSRTCEGRPSTAAGAGGSSTPTP